MAACLASAVPPAGVYFVKFSLMARMAACLMLSGVGKSGSPALKSTTSTPSRRSLSASAMTFIVEETLIEEMRSAMVGLVSVGVIWLPFLCTLGTEPAAQPSLHGFGHEPGDVAAEA